MTDKTIDLSFKNLSSLPSSLNGIIGLNLSGNNFQDEQNLQSLVDLQYISLAHNNLQKQWSLPKDLKRLEINNNLITQLQILPKGLLELDFSNNLLINIVPLHDLQNLQYLFLKNNKIKTIQGLNNLKNLRELDVECNMLSSVEDFVQFEGHQNLTMLNVFGNLIFDLCLTKRLKLLILPIVERNCYCRTLSTFQNSMLFKKQKELMEYDIDFFQELNDIPQIPQRSPEFNISQLYLSRRQQNLPSQETQNGNDSTNLDRQSQSRVEHSSTKSLSPINLINKQKKSYQDLKNSNQTLIQQKYKLQQQLQQSIKQNETFFSEIQSYTSQLQKILFLFDPQLLIESVEELNIHSLLDELNLQVNIYQQKLVEQNIKQMNNFMQRINKKVKLVCSEIQEKAQDKISVFNKKILKVEKLIEKIADQASSSLNINKTNKQLSMHLNQSKIHVDTQQSLTSRHDKHNSDLTTPSPSNKYFKSNKLFLKSTCKKYDNGAPKYDRIKTSQDLESLRTKIKTLEGHIENQITNQ